MNKSSASTDALDGLSFLTAAELGSGYRNGTLKPDDAVESHLTRIAALNGKVHAFIDVYAEEARLAAAQSARRYLEAAPLGPLDGIPIAIKDLIEIEGKVCTAGSATRRHYVAKRSATIIKKLVAQGAIILGKVHTVEFAFGGWGMRISEGQEIRGEARCRTRPEGRAVDLRWR
ncbi:hypothetical protein JQ634_30650 [Bradyrhizobium sp. AUGA SZCCT0240]|uniref:amidase family protein n=1 Tax=unclassified Bradyrhizobium TaxID=2631580 RepID=UPI001BA6D3FC|nr:MULTISPECIES: amidase family protein [unclassified Bradyrhizobium]MBR1199979.1 hypothetical protein [Bradyrhizobium sp. AUGA SZCCT0158]MBR1244347.1 hypothetical protein [Bradyrhizobium sp. AUGA SZCCT0274]MBR1258028.1 hypothetical protein [Bradyrhizobium sp. AUGA SZCCT0240]